MTYLTDAQIHEMADAALTSYEFTACKKAAFRAAKEHSLDEFGINPNKSAVALAFKLAMMSYNECVISTIATIAG